MSYVVKQMKTEKQPVCVRDLRVRTRFQLDEQWYMRIDSGYSSLKDHQCVNLSTGFAWNMGDQVPSEILPPDAVLQIGPEVTS